MSEVLQHLELTLASFSQRLTEAGSPPPTGTQVTTYSRTFPSAGSQRTFRVLLVGSVTFRFLTKPSGSE